MKKILVTGALGQIGSELLRQLRANYGTNNVIGSDIWQKEDEEGPFEIVDVTDEKAIYNAAKKHNADTIMHLAALLSAKAESVPQLAWNLNMGGLMNALEAARELDLQFFTPSSIGAFGPTTPKKHTPQETTMRPTSMYGVNKVAGELLCDYYFYRYGVDTRGVRYPGLISYMTPPGGGTTDYAVEIYYDAIKHKQCTSYIAEGTYMDMMYMPDALNAVVKLMEANPDKLVHRNAYNISAISAAPEDFVGAIQKHIPEFELKFDVDPVRQQIAESWPDNIDSSAAEEEWGFKAEYDIDLMTEDMLTKLQMK